MRIKKLTNRVVFTGYLDKIQMEEYIEKSCLFAMVSISEGLPMVLLEAMSYGVPCIAYKTDSGVTDIIDNDINGYVINNRNEEEYIEKINTFLEDKRIQASMSNEAIKKSKRFTSKSIIKIWEGVINEEK